MPHPKKGDAALRRIKAYIQEKGWTQNKSVDRSTGAVCLSHACYTLGRDAGSATARCRLFNKLPSDGGYGGSRSMVSWNDHPGRTVEDVYALIDQTIKDN